MLQKEAELETLTLEVLKSSEIEGEELDAAQVRSLIARRLGIEIAGMVATEHARQVAVFVMVVKISEESGRGRLDSNQRPPAPKSAVSRFPAMFCERAIGLKFLVQNDLTHVVA